MGRLFKVAALAVVIPLAVAISSINIERTAGTTAISAVSSVQPQAHWTVIGQTFDPWANDVAIGTAHISGGRGPAWVLELRAPADSKWKSYSAVVVINAITGGIAGSEVLASN